MFTDLNNSTFVSVLPVVTYLQLQSAPAVPATDKTELCPTMAASASVSSPAAPVPDPTTASRTASVADQSSTPTVHHPAPSDPAPVSSAAPVPAPTTAPPTNSAPPIAPPVSSSTAPESMRTQLQDGICKPRQCTDGAIRYACLISSSEPLNVRKL
jgi:hypothetical protein